MKRAIVALLLCACTSVAQITAVRAGRLIDPDAGTVLTDQIVLIQGNRIQAVGKGLTVPTGANVIDLSAKTVLPGLIDCHTHVADGHGDGEPFNVLKKTASQIALESVTNARKTLESGVTTCATRLIGEKSSARACM